MSSPDCTTPTKRCRICGQEKALVPANYWRDKTKPDGFSNICSACSTDRAKQQKARRDLERSLPDGMKRCRRCGEVKPATTEYFYTYKHYGLRNQCKACIDAENRDWKQSHPEYAEWCRAYGKAKYWEDPAAASERFRDWRLQDVEYSRKRVRDYYHSNKDKERNRHRRWRTERPEVRRASMKRYHDNHPGLGRVRYMRRKSRIEAVEHNFSEADFCRAIDYFGCQCAVCGRQPGLWHTLAADHWIPISKGGPTIPTNIVPLCHGVGGCNNRKRDTLPDEWLEREFGMRRAKHIARRIADYFEWVRSQATR